MNEADMNEADNPSPPSLVRRRGRPPKNPPALAENPTCISAPPSIPQEQPPAPDSLPSIEDAHQQRGQPEQPTGGVGIFINAVVQVFNPTSPYYGVLFIIGDIKGGKVHGFHMLAGGRKEYVTVGTEECFPIGVSKSRSKEPCSPQWKLEHKMP